MNTSIVILTQAATAETRVYVFANMSLARRFEAALEGYFEAEIAQGEVALEVQDGLRVITSTTDVDLVAGRVTL